MTERCHAERPTVMLSVVEASFKEWHCHPELAEGSLEGLRAGLRFFTSFRMTVVFVQNDGVGFYQAWQKNGVMLSLSKQLLQNGTVTLSLPKGLLKACVPV